MLGYDAGAALRYRGQCTCEESKVYQFAAWDRALAWRTIHLGPAPRELFIRWMEAKRLIGAVSPEKCSELFDVFIAGHVWTLFSDQMIQEN